MELMRDQEIAKLKELLRHTGEFIAYFELAETKMIAWRQDIEEQAQNQHQKIEQKLQNLHQELESLHEVLTQAGLARLRLSAEQTLVQGEKHLAMLEKASQQMLVEIASQLREFNKSFHKQLHLIEQHTQQAIAKIDQQLADYDAHYFKRIANESCIQVEKVATRAIQKSTGLLRSFQWRSVSLALIVTFITSLFIGLYISNELPWEMHQHARNEREAGKVLLKAWPNLSHQEKNKILNTASMNKS
ncbi:hypothetical protein Lqui_1068 [Legionella quinlivanii]|uniref:Uncharacterized protein n=1 Tax=Legionella quinlivanii TaxID=45073 RepID=A0A0W0Y639_9GAMM|nr:hypothetical protein [Legionella quinlivanii]KTD52224.1 hypothetical protein Lqui_1068 [Legionella quinlivanii]SEF75209.1 hypothetical protein SAMN02746093_00985 [Legionella quinlivanii DSM 21216]STY12277.1 Uncharacterised protein [Legionella quinlivanii]